MSSRDLVDIFKEKEDVFDLETIMYVAFMEYKNRKRSREIYNIYDFIPQNLIKLYIVGILIILILVVLFLILRLNI